MKIFGTLSTFVEPTEGNIVVGRQVAAANFLKALSQYSGFDRFDFFLPNPYTGQFLQNYLKQEFGSENLDGRARILDHIQLPEALRNESYDVFHLADFTTYLPALAHLRQNLARNLFPITGLSTSISEKGYDESYFRMMLHGVQDFDGIICLSRCVKESLEKSFRFLERQFEALTGVVWKNPIDLSVIPLAVDASLFGQTTKETARHKLDLPADREIILIFGRLSYADKMDLLPMVELALRLSAGLGNDAPLFLISGSDPLHYGSLLMEYARRRGVDNLFCFRSDIAPEDKPLHYSAADIFLSPSDNLQESFGITILEAMASRLPVVASDLDGYRDLIHSGTTGFCIPTYWGACVRDIELSSGILFRNSHNFYLSQTIAPDLDGMMRVLKTLLTNPSLRMEMGEAGRKKVESEYNWKSVIKSHEELWIRLEERISGRTPVPVSDPFASPYFHIFNHYPTRPLNAEDRMVIAEGGVRLLNEKVSAPIYPELALSIDGETLHFILIFCRRQPRSIGSLQQKLLSARRLSHETTLYHILWALKHGLLRLEK